MESRGVRTPGTETVTSSLHGEIFEHSKARAEFLDLAANSM
jgi:GTP cyclohydrolase I